MPIEVVEGSKITREGGKEQQNVIQPPSSQTSLSTDSYACDF